MSDFGFAVGSWVPEDAENVRLEERGGDLYVAWDAPDGGDEHA